MGYEKPKVTIELAEYNELLAKENQNNVLVLERLREVAGLLLEIVVNNCQYTPNNIKSIVRDRIGCDIEISKEAPDSLPFIEIKPII